MGKIIISIIVISMLLATSIVNVNAFDVGDIISEEAGSMPYNGEPFEGYTLFTPRTDTKIYLINNSGEVVHEWISIHVNTMCTYLLENGNLLHTKIKIPLFFGSGGVTGLVKMFDWDGTHIWTFEYSNILHCLHHDIEPLPNGNILMIAWERKTKNEAIERGRNPENITHLQGFWPDHIIEVEPTFPIGGNIVWEWHVWDHLIQDFDPTKDNYGNVSEHPELIDINLEPGPAIPASDFNHINSIDYNEEYDQILLSAKHQNEIWVIDHSTTTQEAAGHTGGNSGMGGDLLYRWGNPQNYRAGDSDDQILDHQHNARWIESGCPGEGHITIFNNGGYNTTGSSIDEIILPVDNNGYYYLESGSSYGPKDAVWRYPFENASTFNPGVGGSAQRLPNGNTLICDLEKFFEVTYEKEIVWEYINPFPDLPLGLPQVFSIQRYPLDYPGIGEFPVNLNSQSSPTNQQTTPASMPSSNPISR